MAVTTGMPTDRSGPQISDGVAAEGPEHGEKCRYNWRRCSRSGRQLIANLDRFSCDEGLMPAEWPRFRVDPSKVDAFTETGAGASA
jgi:hypothetical protein